MRLFSSNSIRRTGTAIVKTFQDAINTLNTLQSTASVIAENLSNPISIRAKKRDSILRYLNYTGVTPDLLNTLSVIHVAGTKGKGTTSSLCESILRAHGYRTGFYSSPHLVTVNERIRINGKPIEKDYFAKVFHEVYQELNIKKEHETDIPFYFGFLTVMALNIFIRERVDVAIVEVGIGGEYDQTNIVSNVPVVGITSLGYDHTNILGNSIEEIARQKAGIMKRGCNAYTVRQPASAMKVLYEVAHERQCTLHVVPEYESYVWNNVAPDETGLENPTKHLNASLAIQLAHSWMSTTKIDGFEKRNGHALENSNAIVNVLDDKTLYGLKSSFWPGRCQTISLKDKDIYLDGAHTSESMEVCYKWFSEQCRSSSCKILIFYVTKGRKPNSMMKILQNIPFDMVLFVPDSAFSSNVNKKAPKDQTALYATDAEKIEASKDHLKTWKSLINVPSNQILKTFPDVSSAFHFISSSNLSSVDKPQVLITGSLLLVGAAITALELD